MIEKDKKDIRQAVEMLEIGDTILVPNFEIDSPTKQYEEKEIWYEATVQRIVSDGYYRTVFVLLKEKPEIYYSDVVELTVRKTLRFPLLNWKQKEFFFVRYCNLEIGDQYKNLSGITTVKEREIDNLNFVLYQNNKKENKKI